MSAGRHNDCANSEIGYFLTLPEMKLWVDKGSEFYNKLIGKYLENTNINKYNTENEGENLVLQRDSLEF